LGVYDAPVLPPASPLSCDIHHGQIEHFQQAVISRKYRFRLGHLAKLSVEALNGIGGIDQSPNLLGELEIGAEIWPVFPPGLGDFGIFLVPMFRKGFQGISRAAASSTAA
jgi:hypothetical protein